MLERKFELKKTKVVTMETGLDQKSKTDRLGYVPLEKRIQGMLDAGVKLLIARAEQYDFPTGEVDEGFFDPLRRKGVDPAEITQLRYRIEDKYRRAKASYTEPTQDVNSTDVNSTEVPDETPQT